MVFSPFQPSEHEIRPSAEVPHRPGVLGQVRGGGLASTKRGRGEGGDEWPRNDTAEIAPDEGLHLVEQPNSL